MTDTGVISLPLPDAAARAQIAGDLETNLLVEAGAGSGKTTALVGRMASLIESGAANVGHIAAVTFTRKAAGELRERFQTLLETRIRDRSGGDADDLALERLRGALQDIDRAFIGTIHSFCARLLRERPLEVGLDPAFEELALDERMGLRRQFWESYLERATRDSDPVLEQLSGAGLRPARLFGLFDHLVENPDVEFRVGDVHAPSAAELGAVRAELEEIVDLGWELMPDHEPVRGWDSLQKKIRTLHFTRDVTGWREEADVFDALSKLCKAGPRGHNVTLNRWRDGPMAKAFRDRVDAFGVGDTPARGLVNRWYAHRYALAVRLALAAAEAFAAHRIRIGRLDFQDLLVLTARLLRSNVDVRKQLGSRYRRILVDEFQDTDPLQAEIVMLLASQPFAGLPAAEGPVDRGPVDADSTVERASDGELPDWRAATPRPGALFVVGDPKQSIYRFRRADIQLYALVRERFADFGCVLELTANFRSRPPIGDIVNQVFNQPGFFPPVATPEQAAFEPLNTRPEGRAQGGVFVYDIAPEATNRATASRDDAARLATWIQDRVGSGERSPGDFLILTRHRSQIGSYARALEARSLPVQVTGAGVGVEEELRELCALLRCMIDPTNPVKVVAALVGLFFGIDYERLVAHRLEGGGFDAMRPGERGDPEVLDALRQLHSWWRGSTSEPADIFVSRLVTELGLLPYAAASELGELRTGSLLFALDAVRAAALAGDASLPGAIAALDSALSLSEAEAPLEPGRPGVVRLMNLHQAKGLEATVVVLADPSGSSDRRPDVHIERSAGGDALGFLRVAEVGDGFRGDQVLALPEGWEGKEDAERRFEAAEEVRLLYVAVTRAREELVVARWPERASKSPWRALDPWLLEHAEPLDLQPRAPESGSTLESSWAEQAKRATRLAADSLEVMRSPTYSHVSVTEMTKSAREAADPMASDRATGASSAEFRGFSWGNAVHGALAAAAGQPASETLRAICRDLLVEQDRPVDDHGQPLELVELLGLVEAVRASDIWQRAAQSERALTEVPFAAANVPDEDSLESSKNDEGRAKVPLRRQLDLFGLEVQEGNRDANHVQPPAEESSRVLEGVIDLAFRERDGWVVVDYKTDVGADPMFSRRRESYRRQVDLYAKAWERLTGEAVKERVLFYTAQGRLDSW